MRFIHNTREGRNRDLNAGINILGSLATELDGQIRSAYVQLDIREWKRSSQTKNPQRLALMIVERAQTVVCTPDLEYLSIVFLTWVSI